MKQNIYFATWYSILHLEERKNICMNLLEVANKRHSKLSLVELVLELVYVLGDTVELGW